ncbi:hypothetical protein DPMN_038973 [Dreissena polymorpha]|uniref:Uncharacterized protein n=1 Tax=Dreissena polymorpha TaxID=45954 RepID=A0A9D4RQW2_DREPO|nr:hypothetical protein DPMN_038973 [Dreissena polymorpha]
MMNEGHRTILRLPKIRQALIARPEPFRWYSIRRMELEFLSLIDMNRAVVCMDENGVFDETDFIQQALQRRMDDILREVCLRIIMEGGRVNNVDDVCIIMLV